MRCLGRGDHSLDVFHSVSFERLHELLLLHLRQAVIPGVAVQVPELLHVLIGHGLDVESSWGRILIPRLKICGVAVVAVLAHVVWERLLLLVGLGYLRV
jgi:hypothetical protein